MYKFKLKVMIYAQPGTLSELDNKDIYECFRM